MKTIFITSFHVLISRNVLLSGAFRELVKDPDLRIVLFVPAAKLDYFKKNFGGKSVVIEAVPTTISRRDFFLRSFSLLTLKSHTIEIKRHAERTGKGRSAGLFLRNILAWFVAGRAWSRWLLRVLDRRLGGSANFASYFDTYRPSLVFVTDVQNELDLGLAREARIHSVKVIGMVRSWDNLTAKGLLRFVPDSLLVNNAVVQKEATQLNAVSAARIRLVGIPHYDSVADFRPQSREEFFGTLRLDPKKRLALIAPIGDRYVCEFQKNCRNATDRFLLETLVSLQKTGAIPEDLQFLVRLPPTDSVDLAGFESPPQMRLEQPGVAFASGRVKESELSADDDRHLLNSIANADLVITGPSTIAIDAAIQDRPIIVNALEPAVRLYGASIRRFYEYDHFRPILASGGARLVRNPDELANAITIYLRDSGADRAGRRRIQEEECFKLDGRSSERLVRALRDMIDG